MLALHSSPLTATLTETAAVAALMAEPEAAISDAPVASPRAAGGLLLALGLLLSPRTDPKDK